MVDRLSEGEVDYTSVVGPAKRTDSRVHDGVRRVFDRCTIELHAIPTHLSKAGTLQVPLSELS